MPASPLSRARTVALPLLAVILALGGCATSLSVERDRVERLPTGTAEAALARAYLAFLSGEEELPGTLDAAEVIWLETHPWDTPEALADARRDLDFVEVLVEAALADAPDESAPRLALVRTQVARLRAESTARYATARNARMLAAVSGEPRGAGPAAGYWQAHLQSSDPSLRELAADRLERLPSLEVGDAGEPERASSAPPPAAVGGDDDRVRARVERAGLSVVSVIVLDATGVELGQGSGVIVGKSTSVVTNLHVVEHASAARVRTAQGGELPVERIVALDEANDLALLYVPGLALPPMSLYRGAPLRVGDRVLALGAPRGLLGTVSDGIVSAFRELPHVQGRVIQTTAPISEGSSGGALVSSDGQLIGVTTLILERGQNLNFAVPADRVERLLARGRRASAAAPWPGRPLAELPAERLIEASQRALADARVETASRICEAGVEGHPDSPVLWVCVLVTRAARCDRVGAFRALSEVERLDPRAHGAAADVLRDADRDEVWRRCR